MVKILAYRSLAGLVGCCALSAAQAQQPFVVRDVRLFDGHSTTEHRSVLVDSGRIIRIGSADMVARGAREIDGAGRTLLPGLIDSHVHIAEDVESALKQCVLLGVTTVLDMFNSGSRLERMKAIRASDPPGLADLRTAGIGATAPGGHPTQMGGPPIPTLSSPMKPRPGWTRASGKAPTMSKSFVMT